MLPLRTNFTRIWRLFSPSSCQPAAGVCSQDPASTPRVGPRRKASGQGFNEPPSAEFVARVSGIATMARLPHRETADGLDAAFVGVPIDTGTSNRPGARSGYKVRLIITQMCPFSFAPRLHAASYLQPQQKRDISADMFVKVVSEKLSGVRLC